MSANQSAQQSTFEKFGTNPWGIVNSKGEQVTVAYLKRYVGCWCRKEWGYTLNREANMKYFTSEEFFRTCRGLTASQVGAKAAHSPLWGKKNAKADTHFNEDSDSD